MMAELSSDRLEELSATRVLSRQRNLLGLRVEDWTMAELVGALDGSVVRRQPVHVWGISVPFFGMVRRFPQIVEFSQQFDVVIPDGAGIAPIGRLLGVPIRAHVGLPQLASAMIELAVQRGYRLLLLGATPAVNAEAGRRLLLQYPDLDLCPGIDGYYPPEAEEAVARQIHDLKPDVLLVGMSLPKKENFLLRWKDAMQVPVAIACGGYLDVLAGKTTLAPKLIERLAFSWLWRFIQEPRRFFSRILVNELLFVFYILPVALFQRVVAPNQRLRTTVQSLGAFRTKTKI